MVRGANLGRLGADDTGSRTRTPPIPGEYWVNFYTRENSLPAGLPRVTPNSPEFRTPSTRIMEALGSSKFITLSDSDFHLVLYASDRRH
jgi:hypothetical protein